jgi:hypothetical protein
MKRLCLLFSLIIPWIVFAVTNLKLDGQQEIVVTKVPSIIVMTCDLAKPGNRVVGGIYADINNNGVFEPNKRSWDWRYGYMIDGIGTIYPPGRRAITARPRISD